MPAENEPSSRRGRLAATVIGCFLLVMAVAVAIAVERPYSIGTLACLAGLVLLGADAVISAARGRRSLLERVGPLP